MQTTNLQMLTVTKCHMILLCAQSFCWWNCSSLCGENLNTFTCTVQRNTLRDWSRQTLCVNYGLNTCLQERDINTKVQNVCKKAYKSNKSMFCKYSSKQTKLSSTSYLRCSKFSTKCYFLFPYQLLYRMEINIPKGKIWKIRYTSKLIITLFKI